MKGNAGGQRKIKMREIGMECYSLVDADPFNKLPVTKRIQPVIVKKKMWSFDNEKTFIVYTIRRTIYSGN